MQMPQAEEDQLKKKNDDRPEKIPIHTHRENRVLIPLPPSYLYPRNGRNQMYSRGQYWLVGVGRITAARFDDDEQVCFSVSYLTSVSHLHIGFVRPFVRSCLLLLTFLSLCIFFFFDRLQLRHLFCAKLWS